MLRLAGVTRDDLVYDLGSGDGRIVIAAARDFGARAVGVEIDPKLIRDSEENARSAGVSDRVRFIEKDLFQIDLREATVVTLFLLPGLNEMLAPKLMEDPCPGTRIVSHMHAMGDWQPDKTVRSRVDNLSLGAASGRSGAWQIDIPTARALASDALIRQTFQKISGSAGSKTEGSGRTIPASRAKISVRRIIDGQEVSCHFRDRHDDVGTGSVEAGRPYTGTPVESRGLNKPGQIQAPNSNVSGYLRPSRR
jgi:hypothetical protein